MKRALLTILLAAAVLLPGVSLSAKSKIPYDSIRPVQDRHEGSDDFDTFCTAWATTLHGKTVWVTAAHCVGDPDIHYFIGGQSAKTTKIDVEKDLATLDGPSAPGLHIAFDMPKVGSEVYISGYMGGQNERIYGRGYVSVYRFTGPDISWYSFFSLGVGPGHSGSPIMTLDNLVVSVAQWVPCSNPFTGGAAPCPYGAGVYTGILRDFLGLD